MGAGSKPASTNAATGMIGNPTRGRSQTFCWKEHLYASARAANGLEPVSFSLLFHPLASLTAAGQGKNVKKLQLMIKN
jgi:hypothetical protein